MRYLIHEQQRGNKLKKKVYGIGVNDIDLPAKEIESYPTWASMLQRCYSQKCQDSKPTYIGCSVHEGWHLLSVFHEFYTKHYKPGYQLDKDILFPENKRYSPDTCIFVPAWVNLFVIDRAAKRGTYPIGVCKKGDKFLAQIKVNGKDKHLGYFTTPEQAHTAWKQAKRQQVIDRQQELDQIDPRLFQALLARYTDNVIQLPHQPNNLLWLQDYPNTKAA